MNQIISTFTFKKKKISSSPPLVGIIYSKEIGKQLQPLTDECQIEIQLLNETNQDYLILVTNTEKTGLFNQISMSIGESTFNQFTNESCECLLWEYHKTFYVFKILFDQENDKNFSSFMDILKKCIVSCKEKISLSDASKSSNISNCLTHFNSIEDIDAFIEKLQPKKNEEDEIQLISSQLSNVSIKYKKKSDFFDVFNAKLEFSAIGELYQYKEEEDNLFPVLNEKSYLNIYLVDSKKFEFGMAIETKEGVVLYDIFKKDGNDYLKEEDKVFMWITDMRNNLTSCAMGFIFDNEKDVQEFKKVISKCRYETSNLTSYENLEEEEKIWLERENEPEDFSIDINELDFDFEKGSEVQSEQKNKFTTQAYLFDRTFSVREDNTIGVYKTNESDCTLNILMNLPAIQEYNGKGINLKDGKMFQADTNILFLDQKNAGKIWQYDIPKSKIINEWSVENESGNNEIISIAPQNKMDQMTNNHVVYALNSNNIFELDGRLNKANKVVNTKTYKTDPKMSCIATTKGGYIATGSKTGEIRLYDEVGKNAKNRLALYGDELLGIDVTADGKYVLGTCEKYLILIRTVCKNESSCGFVSRMEKDRPAPKTLKIKPIDIKKFGLEKARFTPAKFNLSQEGETNITTSLGEYIIIWNFKKVLKGILDDYKIKKVNQFVIDNQFKYNKNQIIVTMPTTLRIQNQKSI